MKKRIVLSSSIFLTVLLALIIALSACGSKPVQPFEADTKEPDTAPPQATNIESKIEQIKSGDFSGFSGLSEYTLEVLNGAYSRQTKSQTIEWVEHCDLNENWSKALIWQEVTRNKHSHRESRRIYAVFAIKDDEVIAISMLLPQMTSYYFLGKNGNIIYTYSTYGTNAYSHYKHYIFNDDGNLELAYGLEVIEVEDWYIDQLKEENRFDNVVAKYPYQAKSGIYYFSYADGESGDSEELDERQFLEAFEEMTGYSFYYDNPEKPGWVS